MGITEHEINQITQSICNRISGMVECALTTNLENAIDINFPAHSTGGLNTPMSMKYRERVRVGVDTAGSPVYEWVCGNTKEELHEAIAALLSGRSSRSAEQRTVVNAPLWEACAKHWFETYHLPRISPKTVSKDTSLMKRHVLEAFSGTPINQISTDDVQAFLKTRSSFCKSVVRDVMAMLRQIFAAAVEDGYIGKNPMASRRIYNTSEKPDGSRRALTPLEQADIISHLDDIKSPPARRFMAFLMFTCMRPCEIYGLRWDDIDFERGIIHIKRDLVFINGSSVLGKTKTEGSARPIPISPELMRYLTPREDTGFVICSPGGGEENPMISSESVARRMWNQIKQSIDVHGMTPYMGRHTFATNMSRANVPIKAAMALMGHTDERMLLRQYTHIDNDDLLNANETMSRFISSMKPQKTVAL